MEQKNYFKLFCAIAFIAFAIVSCWATVESLHLLLSAKDSNIPIVFVWIITIGFFFIASWGSKMIVDSLNSHVYTENPGLKLTGGVIIMIIFWLLMSMPTNTHTFFYKDTIKDVAIRDLEKTNDYLRTLETDEIAMATIEHDWAIYEREVWTIYNNMLNEVNNPNRPGIGDHVENYLKQLETKLEMKEKITRIPPKTNTLKGWHTVMELYRSTIINELDKKKKEYITRFVVITPEVKEKIKNYRENIRRVLNDIHKMSSINDKVMVNAGLVLSESYGLINQYSDGHLKLDENDKKIYAGNVESKTARMLSVWDVWMDFFNGRIARGKFVFWMILSILIDVAGFIFFDMAFKREE